MPERGLLEDFYHRGPGLDSLTAVVEARAFLVDGAGGSPCLIPAELRYKGVKLPIHGRPNPWYLGLGHSLERTGEGNLDGTEYDTQYHQKRVEQSSSDRHPPMRPDARPV